MALLGRGGPPAPAGAKGNTYWWFLDGMDAIDKVVVVGVLSGDRMTEYTKPGYERCEGGASEPEPGYYRRDPCKARIA